MIDFIKCLGIIALYIVCFLGFGLWVRKILKFREVSFSLAITTGFFAYYALFQIITIPMMFSLQKLSSLTLIWGIVLAIIVLSSLIVNNKDWSQCIRGIRSFFIGRNIWSYAIVFIVLINVILVSVLYSSYWDATYYVGTVSFSVYNNTINTINPLTGVTYDMFDLKHCLATYHMNDAVFCQLFNIHPLIETKTIMVIVVTIIANIIFYQLSKLLFPESKVGRMLMLAFILLIQICTYSSYTSSSFFLLRTYEGKAITSTITVSMILYLFIRIEREWGKWENWLLLFLTSWGAVAISSSAMFLVPVSIGCFSLVEAIRRRQINVLAKGALAALPSIVMLICYMLYRVGVLYFYAHPI